MTMLEVTPFPTKEVPNPLPVMIGPMWIQMVENADFTQEAETKAPPEPPASEGVEPPVGLHPTVMAMPIVTRTKITLHDGNALMVKHSFAEMKAMLAV